MDETECPRCRRLVYEEQQTECPDGCGAKMCLGCEDDHECGEEVEL